MPPKIRTESTFPTTLEIDGVAIDVRVKRMTNTEFDAFSAGLDRWSQPRGTDESPEAHQAREAASATWMREALDAYLTIVPGEYEHCGREITQGGELVDIYAGRLDVVPQAIALVFTENRLSEAKKKASRLALASQLGLPSAPPPTAPGDAPAPIAAGVEPSGSAPIAAVANAPHDGSSGTTAPSV